MTIKTHVLLDEKTKKAAKKKCAETGAKLSPIINILLKKWIEEK